MIEKRHGKTLRNQTAGGIYEKNGERLAASLVAKHNKFCVRAVMTAEFMCSFTTFILEAEIFTFEIGCKGGDGEAFKKQHRSAGHGESDVKNFITQDPGNKRESPLPLA